ADIRSALAESEERPIADGAAARSPYLRERRDNACSASEPGQPIGPLERAPPALDVLRRVPAALHACARCDSSESLALVEELLRKAVDSNCSGLVRLSLAARPPQRAAAPSQLATL